MADVRRYQVWVDSDGQNGLTYITGNALLGGLVATMLPASFADIQNFVESLLNVNAAPAPLTGTFHSVRDQAILQYLCADGTVARLTIPAPRASIFLADQETVDPTAVLLITATAIGLLVSATGSPAVSFLAGIRVRKAQPLLK